ncbi:uncharacterized protein LOC132271557 isoform X3 [Cornus florida]|uniref:uncharacterized protein LOC132271557 isoform X3 n=1 Tax=Cornus florida TaxID=4283 RepID=UPI00289EF477|nr:uncharacterized protein LOC132271557 isoform X3 [Cornus florida]
MDHRNRLNQQYPNAMNGKQLVDRPNRPSPQPEAGIWGWLAAGIGNMLVVGIKNIVQVYLPPSPPPAPAVAIQINVNNDRVVKVPRGRGNDGGRGVQNNRAKVT